MIKEFLSFSFLVLLFLLTCLNAFGQDSAYKITVKLDNFDQDSLFLGYHFAEKQYIKDSIAINDDGVFVFEGDEALKCGIHLLILPPNNSYMQLLIDQDQEFSLSTDAKEAVKNMSFEGSELNTRFYEYLNFLGGKGPEAKAINEKIAAAKEAGKDSKAEEEMLNKINTEVDAFQKQVIEQNEGNLLATIIKGSRDIDLPEFDDSEEGKKARYYYIKQHWFDNVDLADPCILRTSLFQKKIDTYLKNLTPQHPDSISQSLDRILTLAEPNEETYRHLLVKFLNQFAKSKIIGMDKVYVHLALDYYKAGKAPWTDEESLTKIIDNAERLVPILIGETAPDINLPVLDIEGTLAAKDHESEHRRFKFQDTLSLHNIDSRFTILYIWSPDCGHCKKATPKMIETFDKLKDKGVTMYAICHRTYKDTPSCAEYIDENPGMLKWINLNDPYFKSKYNVKYDVKSTPQLYILDENKEILLKRVGADQLEEVMESLFSKEELRKNTK